MRLNVRRRMRADCWNHGVDEEESDGVAYESSREDSFDHCQDVCAAPR